MQHAASLSVGPYAVAHLQMTFLMFFQDWRDSEIEQLKGALKALNVQMFQVRRVEHSGRLQVSSTARNALHCPLVRLHPSSQRPSQHNRDHCAGRCAAKAYVHTPSMQERKQWLAEKASLQAAAPSQGEGTFSEVHQRRYTADIAGGREC